MPFETGGYVQSVVVQRRLYVGGGFDGSIDSDTNYIVMEYDIYSGRWATLSPYRARAFAMTAINNQLLLVGGDEHGDESKLMGVWEADQKAWTHPYPEMLSAHSFCSAVVYNEWLVVAGGYTQVCMMSTVEVLDISTKQWYIGPSAPVAWRSMKTAVVGDTGYFMGGWDITSRTEKVYRLCIQTLISHINLKKAPSEGQNIWSEIPGLQLVKSTPLSINGLLLAVGGRNKEDQVVTAIHLYQPNTEEWVKVGDLPSARYQCTCAKIAGNELLVAGGDNDNYEFLKRVDIALLT